MLEDALLDGQANNFLASVAVLRQGEEAAMAWAFVTLSARVVRFVCPRRLGRGSIHWLAWLAI